MQTILYMYEQIPEPWRSIGTDIAALTAHVAVNKQTEHTVVRRLVVRWCAEDGGGGGGDGGGGGSVVPVGGLWA